MSATTCLLYLSEASGPLDAVELESLLQRAREHNRSRGITGALLHYDGRFLQALEGESGAVAACFERIRLDPRHRQITPVFEGQVAQRRFGDWAMRHVALRGPADRAVAAFLDALRHAPQPEAVGQALTLLKRLGETSGQPGR